MKKVIVLISLILCLGLVGCEQDKTNQIIDLGDNVVTYLNDSSDDIYHLDYPSNKKTENGYSYSCVIESKMTKSYNGTWDILFNKNGEITSVDVEFEYLSQYDIANISYSLQAYYLNIMSDDKKLFNIGKVEKDNINNVITSLSNISMYQQRKEDMTTKTGNYTTALTYEWSSAFDNGTLKLTISK